MTQRNAALPLIRLSALNPFLSELERRGVDPRRLLRELELPDSVPASPDVFVSSKAMYLAVEMAADLARDSYLGFHIGHGMTLSTWDPIAVATQKAHTVGELLNHFIVSAQDHSSATRYFLKTEAERSTFGFKRTVKPQVSPAQNDAFYLGFIGRIFITTAGDHWDARRVLFRVAEPTAIPPMPDSPRIAQSDETGIEVVFPTEWLFDPFEASTLDDRGFEIEEPLDVSSIVDSVHRAVKPHLHEPGLTVERVAKICGYSKRSLSRLLREHGTTIANEIAALRAERAGRHLIESQRRVAEIGEAVGFTDPTVFSRAFKNWTGQSPRAYRKIHTQ